MGKFLLTKLPLTEKFYVQEELISVFPLSLIYLAIPAFIFLFGFIEPLLAYPIASILAITLWLNLKQQSIKEKFSIYILAIIPTLFLLLVVGFPSGPFAWDWIKHWALINLLADHHWPTAIPLKDGIAWLRFYIGAYLVPAGLHKLWPDIPTWAATAFWFGLGYTIVFRWAAIPFSKKNKLTCLLSMFALLMFAGADFYAENFFRMTEGIKINNWFGLHYEMWFPNAGGGQVQYSSMLVAFLWVPHQSIATFLVAAMVAFDRAKDATARLLLAFGLLSLWSPYGMIGLLPLVIVRVFQDRSIWLRPKMLMSALAGGGFASLVAYYLSTDMPGNGMCIRCGLSIDSLQYTAGFLCVELLAFWLILYKKLSTDRICLFSFITLLLIPRFGGQAADFTMRASMGPLLILSLRCIEMLSTWRLQKTSTRLSWVLALMLCLPTAISEIFYHIEDGRAHKLADRRDPLIIGWYRTFAQSPDIGVSEFFDICGWHYLPQYFTYQIPHGINVDSLRKQEVR